MARKKPKLGSGARFKTLVDRLMREQGISRKRAEAIAASIGRKKFGKKRFAQLGRRGK